MGRWSLLRKPKGHSAETEGRPVFVVKPPTLVPDGPIFMQMTNPNVCSLVAPNSTVPIGPYEDALTGWYRCKWGYCCEVPIAPGNSQSYWSKDDARRSLTRLDSDHRSRAGGWQFSLWLCPEMQHPREASASHGC